MAAFQPTRPRGARRFPSDVDYSHYVVSTHAPTRGATALVLRGFKQLIEFQPTRPRGARRLAALKADHDVGVSTHAPTRGATSAMALALNLPTGFNPRAHAGRDFTRCVIVRTWPCFNPRAHAGRDQPLPSQPPQLVTFQPTRPRGARLCGSRRPMYSTAMFQPTRPRGARLVRSGLVAELLQVSTHAPTRGATPLCRRRSSISAGFNPRAHAGRDREDQQSQADGAEVSTHAPTRGATRACEHQRVADEVSTHAPTRGATGVPRVRLTDLGEFQPTRPRGARRGRRAAPPLRQRVSTHAPTRGATAACRAGVAPRAAVSTHAPTRGATLAR